MTLIDAAFWTKILLRLSIFVVIGIVGGYYGYTYLTREQVTPRAIFKPDYLCGNLPALSIPSLKGYDLTKVDVQTSNVSQQLDLPPIAYVYQFDVRGELPNASTLAENTAKIFGMENATFTRTSDKYTWEDKVLKRRLIVDRATLNFDYDYDLTKLPKAPNVNLPNQAFKVIPAAQDFLDRAGLNQFDFLGTSDPFTYGVVITKEGKIKEVQSTNDAQLIRIDFQKQTTALQYDKRILNPNFARPATIDFVNYLNPDAIKDDANRVTISAPRVSTSNNTGNVQMYIQNPNAQFLATALFKMSVRNWKIVTLPCGTYPIYSPSDAINLIKEGKGSLVHIATTGGDRLNSDGVPQISSLVINSVQLAYLETPERQSLLQPIFVATGKANFVDNQQGEFGIYVSAIQSSGN